MTTSVLQWQQLVFVLASRYPIRRDHTNLMSQTYIIGFSLPLLASHATQLTSRRAYEHVKGGSKAQNRAFCLTSQIPAVAAHAFRQ